MTSEVPSTGLVGAYLFDGRGGGRAVGWEGIKAWTPGDEHLWVHLDRTNEESQEWLKAESGLSEFASAALLAEETRSLNGWAR